jgi:hypothetical protein
MRNSVAQNMTDKLHFGLKFLRLGVPLLLKFVLFYLSEKIPLQSYILY